MTLTRTELAQVLSSKVGSKKRSARLIECFFELLQEQLVQGADVKVSGFGKFAVRRKKARLGRNPKTQERVIIKARRVVTFAPSPVLRHAVNKKLLFRDDTIARPNLKRAV